MKSILKTTAILVTSSFIMILVGLVACKACAEPVGAGYHALRIPLALVLCLVMLVAGIVVMGPRLGLSLRRLGAWMARNS